MARSAIWLTAVLSLCGFPATSFQATWADDAGPTQPEKAAASAASEASASGGAAAAAATATASTKDEVTPEQIQLWIKDLDNDKFAVRETASQRLLGAGATAIVAVAAAVDSKSREVSMRAMKVLEQLHRTGGADVQEKTRAALEKIAQNADSSAAQKANEILKPQPDPAQGPGIIFGPGIPFGGRIQINGGILVQAGMQAGNAQQMIRMQNINGRRTVDASEGDRKIHIEDDPQTGIEIKVTEKVDGKEKITKYAAKNLDELKKNHAEGAQIYQKYAGNAAAGIIQVQVGNQNFPIPNLPQPNNLPGNNAAPGNNAPFGPRPGAPVPAAGANQAATEIAAARKLLSEAKQQLAGGGGVQRAIEQLQAADERLADAEGKLAK